MTGCVNCRVPGHLSDMKDVTIGRAGITETIGRPGQIAAMRRMLLAFGVGGALGCLLWMAVWLSTQL